ncbi:MAG: glycosyltransferase [Bacteroidota bacterium]
MSKEIFGKKLKILHLPSNIASQPAITVKALNEAGHHAIGLFLDTTITQSSEGMIVINYNKKSPFKVFKLMLWYCYFLRYIYWADVIHWCGSFQNTLLKVTLPVIKFLKKPALVEFVGSDIRNPEVEFKDNPYYKKVFTEGYEYPYESAANSYFIQNMFARNGFGVLIMPGMGQYIADVNYKFRYPIFQRIDSTKFSNLSSKPPNSKPLIIHSPSAPVGKGSKYVIAAIDELKKYYDFDFKLIKGMGHVKTLELISSCDIFIDQLISGSYGMATMEALTMGKPVICFLKESVLKNELPADIPIVNGNPDNIKSKIEILLNDAGLRIELGEKGKTYIEKYHNVKKVAADLEKIYYSAIVNK